jgi:hypothetical protein
MSSHVTNNQIRVIEESHALSALPLIGDLFVLGKNFFQLNNNKDHEFIQSNQYLVARREVTRTLLQVTIFTTAILASNVFSAYSITSNTSYVVSTVTRFALLPLPVRLIMIAALSGAAASYWIGSLCLLTAIKIAAFTPNLFNWFGVANFVAHLALSAICFWKAKEVNLGIIDCLRPDPYRCLSFGGRVIIAGELQKL